MSITLLGAVAGQTSAAAQDGDATYIVGTVNTAIDQEAVLWTVASPTAAPAIFGGSTPAAANGLDTLRVVGYTTTAGARVGAIWDASSPTTAPTALGLLTGGSGWNHQANAIDGTTIVGQGSNPTNVYGAMWDALSPASATQLGTIAGQSYASANAVSGDHIVGEADDGSGAHAVLWSVASPATSPTLLGAIVGQVSSLANGVDGSVIVGEADDATTGYAVAWDATNPTAAPTMLGSLAGQTFSTALGILGSVIVGEAVDGSGDWAVYWDAANPTAAPTILDAIPSQAFASALAALSSPLLAVGFANDGSSQAALWSSATPPPAPHVQIKIAGTDLTGPIQFATAEFVSAVNGTTGTCKFRVRDDTASLIFTTGETIELLVDGDPVWTGFIATCSRVYAFPAENVVAAGPTRWFDITGVDINVLFNRRVVFDQANGANTFGTLFPPATADSTAIADLFANWLDLSGDGLNTSSGIATVADINVDQEARAWSGGYTWAQAFASIAMLPGAVYFIDPSKVVDYVDVNTPTAPFGLSDQPDGVTTVGYREMSILLDGTSLANDVLAWGIGYGSASPVFARVTDATSLAAHGLWQAGTTRSGVYKQATINRIATSIVDGSPSNLRGSKDDRTAVTLVTYVPGFLPAQKVDFTSAVFGFSDVIPIRRMRVTFDAPDTPRYELTISHAIDSPWGFVDPMLVDLNFRLPRPTVPQLPTCQAVFDDPFSRTVVGSWGSSPAPLVTTWSPVFTTGGPGDISYSVAGGPGLIDFVTGAALAVRNNADVSAGEWISGQWSLTWQATFTGTQIVAQVGVMRPPAVGPQWIAALDFNLLSTGPFLVLRFATDAGSITSSHLSFGGWSGVTYQFRLTFDFASFSLLGRIWAAGTQEPNTWDLSLDLTTWPYGSLSAADLPTDAVSVLTQTSNAGAQIAFDYIRLDCEGTLLSQLTASALGNTCQAAIRQSSTVYATSAQFIPGSTKVWRAGLLQRLGTDYTEDSGAKSVTFDAAIDDPATPVWMCYLAAVTGS